MDIGFLLLRLTVGLILAVHGTQELFGWVVDRGLDATGQFFEMTRLKDLTRAGTTAARNNNDAR